LQFGLLAGLVEGSISVTVALGGYVGWLEHAAAARTSPATIHGLVNFTIALMGANLLTTTYLGAKLAPWTILKPGLLQQTQSGDPRGWPGNRRSGDARVIGFCKLQLKLWKAR